MGEHIFTHSYPSLNTTCSHEIPFKNSNERNIQANKGIEVHFNLLLKKIYKQLRFFPSSEFRAGLSTCVDMHLHSDNIWLCLC